MGERGGIDVKEHGVAEEVERGGDLARPSVSAAALMDGKISCPP